MGLTPSTPATALIPICTSGSSESRRQRAVITVIAIPNTITGPHLSHFPASCLCSSCSPGSHSKKKQASRCKLKGRRAATVAADPCRWFPPPSPPPAATCARLPEGEALTRLRVAAAHPQRKLLIWGRNCLVAHKWAAVMECRWRSRRRRRTNGPTGGSSIFKAALFRNGEKDTKNKGRKQSRNPRGASFQPEDPGKT